MFQVEVSEVPVPCPTSDERVERVCARWHSPGKMNAEDPSVRPVGIFARKVRSDGGLGAPVWFDSAGLFWGTWDAWLDLRSVSARSKLRAALVAAEGPVRVGYAAAVRGYETLAPVGELEVVELLGADCPRGELDVLGRAPQDPEARGAQVRRSDGTQVWVADRHHLFVDVDDQLSEAERGAAHAALAEELAPALAEAGFGLGLGRWAPSGNRYNDDARFADVVPAKLPHDASWLTLRARASDPGCVEVGVEALARLLVADDDLRYSLAAQLEAAAARHAPRHPAPTAPTTT